MPSDDATEYGSDLWLAGLEPDRPEEDRVAHAEWVVGAIGQRRLDGLTPADVEALQVLTRDENARVRVLAVGLLCEVGPVTWEDLERWALDADADIRWEVVDAMDWNRRAAGRLAESDNERWAAVVAAAAERYGEMPSLSASMREGPWLDAMWPRLGRLLDLGKPDLNSSIICGYLEDALVYGGICPGDPRLEAWIQGDSIERKMALLSVVQWFGMREEWQRQIVEALSRDPIPVVAETAGAFLADRAVPDIQCRDWASGAQPPPAPRRKVKGRG